MLPLVFAAMLADPPPSPLEYVDTGFENASPLWHETAEDGTILLHLNYDHERGRPNRAAGHFHFALHAPKGAALTLEFRNLDNIYNGKPGSVAKELGAAVVSADGKRWESLAAERVGERVRLRVTMPGPRLFVARLEPYRIADLDALLASIQGHPSVEVAALGKTVQGRPLEIVRLGDPAAPRRVFLRARAHPWESGGNWVVQGLVRRLTAGDDAARRFLAEHAVWILPMANKDGVAAGRTRFNLCGKDLNRDWDRPADPALAPENHALEQWLERMSKAGRRPHLALELHNDGNGKLHVVKPAHGDGARLAKRLGTLETLLRKHTWFVEGATPPQAGVSTLAAGLVDRYGIDAAVHEFNGQWLAGLSERPLGKHWEAYGAKLPEVFRAYFDAVKP